MPQADRATRQSLALESVNAAAVGFGLLLALDSQPLALDCCTAQLSDYPMPPPCQFWLDRRALQWLGRLVNGTTQCWSVVGELAIGEVRALTKCFLFDVVNYISDVIDVVRDPFMRRTRFAWV